MKKVLEFLKIFTISLLGGLLGGVLMIAIHYWLGFLFGILLVGVGTALFYWYFRKCYIKRRWKESPIVALSLPLSVAIVQFFDILICYAGDVVGETGNRFKDIRTMYQKGYFDQRGQGSGPIMRTAILQEYFFSLGFALITCAIVFAIMYYVVKKNGTDTEESGRKYKIGGNKK